MAYVATNYFVTVSELTAHNTVSAHEDVVQPSPLLPFVPYAPFVISGLLFVIAFGMFFINRVHNWKNITSALVVALMIAGIPAILTYVGQGARQTTNAGPEEIPRSVRVAPTGPTSVRISWTTDADRIGVVRISKVPFTSSTARLYLADNQDAVRIHSVDIDMLARKQSYEFEILSGTTWYDNNGAYIRFSVP